MKLPIFRLNYFFPRCSKYFLSAVICILCNAFFDNAIAQQSSGSNSAAASLPPAVVSDTNSTLQGSPVVPAATPGATTTPKTVADGIEGLALGISMDEAIAILKKNSIFAFRGMQDVTLLPTPNQSLIEASGYSFVSRVFLQFYENKLWTIIVYLNPHKLDYYSVYTNLTSKYGTPGLFNPQEARWEDKSARMALEKPLTLRYMDMEVYNKLLESSRAQESLQEKSRQAFLDGL